jgi:putative nucleotidyltransferase with HDIG domain
MDLKQELFKEMDKHLLEDSRPSEYFVGLHDAGSFAEFPFDMLGRLKHTRQSPVYHQEGNVWNHTMLVIDEAAGRQTKSSNARVFMWAALLHDIGKPGKTRNHRGKITSYDHDKLGAELAGKFLRELTEDNAFIENVAALVRWHMQILFVVKALPFAAIKVMKEQTSIDDVALLGLCDRLGRLGADRKAEEENIRIFLEKCKAGDVPAPDKY